MPMNPTDYHPDWPAISRQIREQAGNACERCGVANHAVGARDRRGEWHDETDMEGMNSTTGFSLWPDGYPKVIRIVLTVAHLCDCDKRACRDPSHLQALCQRCHLNLDRPHHLAVQKVNREQKRLSLQPRLLGV